MYNICTQVDLNLFYNLTEIKNLTKANRSLILLIGRQ